eukprot:TRINITY_DN1114_c0_g1_i8.p2 TRINITY_DN1114_c0_g1~~TRINITY_DN1114_c0_g1_i8.p2  ORF type:complete len:223 (-),score=50.57 TRINITY_DN1114_c0_g1_i8:45-713(-)
MLSNQTKLNKKKKKKGKQGEDKSQFKNQSELEKKKQVQFQQSIKEGWTVITKSKKLVGKDKQSDSTEADALSQQVSSQQQQQQPQQQQQQQSQASDLKQSQQNVKQSDQVKQQQTQQQEKEKEKTGVQENSQSKVEEKKTAAFIQTEQDFPVLQTTSKNQQGVQKQLQPESRSQYKKGKLTGWDNDDAFLNEQKKKEKILQQQLQSKPKQVDISDQKEFPGL